MVIFVQTNRPGFFNDIAEEIRLFFPACEVLPLEPCSGESGGEAGVLSVNLVEEAGQWRTLAELRQEEKAAAYVYTYPAVQGSPLVVKRYEKRCVKVAAFRACRRLFPDTNLPWGSLTGIRPTRLLRELVEVQSY